MDLSNHMKATYRTLRLGVALLGLALPLVLWIGGGVFGLSLQGSMSAYYYTTLRDVWVGVLFAVSGMLVVYRGYTLLEDWALNLGGVFLAGVAIFPMAERCEGDCPAFALHGALAFLFFLCIAYVCIFRASDTLNLVADELRRIRYRRTYQLLGGLMIASPAIAFVLSGILQLGASQRSIVFFDEAVGVYVFSAYWLVKSWELRATDAEGLAGHGQLTAGVVHGIRDVVATLPVAKVEAHSTAA